MRIVEVAGAVVWAGAAVCRLDAQSAAVKGLQSETRLIENLMNKGKTTEAAAAADSAIKKKEMVLNIPSSAGASLYGTAGAAQLKAGDWDKAGQYLERAVKTEEKASAPDAPTIADWFRDLGTVYERSGDPAKAEAAYWRSVSLKTLQKDDKGKAVSLRDLAGFYVEHGAYGKALSAAKEAVDLSAKGSEERAMALLRLGEAYAGNKDYPAAEELYAEARGILQRLFGKDSPKVLPALNDLGLLMRQKGDLKGAYAYFSQAYDIQKTAKETPEEAPKILNNFASIYVASSEYDKAARLYQQAADLNVGGVVGGVGSAVARNNLAVLDWQRGDKAKSGQEFDMAIAGRPLTASLNRIVVYNRAVVTGAEPPPPAPETAQQVQRYATVKAPTAVNPDQEVEVSAALTEKNQTPGVVVGGPKVDNVNGTIVLTLQGKDPTPVSVVIVAPQFELVSGSDSQTIKVPRSGDSDTAVFRLRLKPAERTAPVAQVVVNFIQQSAFLASAIRNLTVNSASRTLPREEEQPAAAGSTTSSQAAASGSSKPDLSLSFDDFESAGGPTCRLTIAPRDKAQQVVNCTPTNKVQDRVTGRFAEVLNTVGANARTFNQVNSSYSDPFRKPKLLAGFNGFGKELYGLAPPEMQTALADLQAAFAKDPKTRKHVEIYTSDATIPWELMIIDDKHPPDGLGFLGTEMDVARWILHGPGKSPPLPPDQVTLKELDAIVPHYEGGARLPNQEAEYNSIKPIHGSREVPGTYADVSKLLGDPPDGIVHFAGHGLVQTGGGVEKWVIQLEGGSTLSLTEWRGLVNQGTSKHSLYFLNACDIGTTAQVANFVYGWGPTVLDTGGSGFIGGMWPLTDKGASEFASIFYSKLQEAYKTGTVEVSELVRQARRKFAETGDPTYLGYVFYGDVGLKLVP